MTDKQNDVDGGSENTNAVDPWTEGKQQVEEPTAAASQPVSNQGVSDNGWQQNLINRLAFASLNEQRRARRWNIFFKALFFVYLFTLLFLYFPSDTGDLHVGAHTAVIEINGEIADDAVASADNIIGGLREAFKDKNTKGIVLRINSPGGSAVQAGYVNDEIYRLKAMHPDVPVYAVVTDLCASAAYYIAVSADKIYADKGSLVGSIGVLMNGYGFVDTMKKLGVERRLLTAGAHKGFLDPFSPMKDDDKKHMQSLLNDIHQQFIGVVKKGRGDRLANDPNMFSGLIWSGEKGVELGLVDALGSTSQVARDIIGAEKVVDFTPRPGYFDRFAERIGASMATGIGAKFMSQRIE